MNVFFYIAAAIALVSSVMTITRNNAIHALLYLILSLLSISVIFFILGAPFIAALEVIIYAGGNYGAFHLRDHDAEYRT